MAVTSASSAAGWEKPASVSPKRNERLKFLVGGGLIAAAVVFLIASGTAAGARFFITVDEVVNNAAYIEQSVRITGAVVGDTIQYDSENLIIDFTIVHVSSEFDDLGEAMHQAVSNPTATRLRVHVEDQVKPDSLRHEAQAILTGTLGADGIFYASELQFKCPTRFVEGMPESLLDEGIVESGV